MANVDHDPTSPPSGDSQPGPSIYAYRTRLLSNQEGSQDPANGGNVSPSRSSTLSRMTSLRDEQTVGGLRRAGSGARIGSHTRGGKSVYLARGQWEAKIEAASTVEDLSPALPLARPRSMLMSTSASQQRTSHVSAPPPAPEIDNSTTAASRGPSLSSTRSTPALRDRANRATVLGDPGWDSAKAGNTQAAVKFPAEVEHTPPTATSTTTEAKAATTATDLPSDLRRLPRDRPSSITSFTTLSPNVTGTSIASTARTKSAVDTLAEARANALRRREAKMKAGVSIEEHKIDLPTPPHVPAKVEINLEDFAPIIRPAKIASLSRPPPPPPKEARILPALSKDSNNRPAAVLAKALPTTTPDSSTTTLRSSPFGERLRPAAKPAQTQPATQAPEPAAITLSPFGERVKATARLEPPVAAKSEPEPTPRPTQTTDTLNRTTSRTLAERLDALKLAESKPVEPRRIQMKASVDDIRQSLHAAATAETPKTAIQTRASVDDIRKSLRIAASAEVPKTKIQTRTSVDDIRKSLHTAANAEVPKTTVQTRTSIDDIRKSLHTAVAADVPRTTIDIPKRTVSDTVAKAASPATPDQAKMPASGKPKLGGLGFRAPTGPPKGGVSSLANRFGSGEIGATPVVRGRVPSHSHDGRRLGKHLPRIVSGDQGWDGDSARRASISRKVSTKDGKSSLSRATPLEATEENTPPRPKANAPVEVAPPSPAPPSRPKDPLAPLTPSHTINREMPLTPATPTSKKAAPRSNLLANLTGPLGEVHGAEMKGLMSAISAAPARQGKGDGGDGVTGMSNRVRLSQLQRLPLAASSAKMAPAPLPSRRLAGNNNWMDRQRHDLAAYEYLCHIGEAQQWIEGCLDEELEFGVTEMEEALRDGVVLAKLARVFQGEEVVRRIWTEAKHRYRQSDNINYYLNFVRTVGMPETFIFELTDLYNKKNIPKVIFCIHVLSHLLARLGRAERMNNLVGQFEFTDEQLAATKKGIQGVAMPNFQQVGQTLAKEASWEPEPEEEEEEQETEDERRDRELLECEPSITALQKHMRGVLARSRAKRVKTQLKLAAPTIVQLQSQIRGHRSRNVVKAEKRSHQQLRSWATKFQAVARGNLARRRWQRHVTDVRRIGRPIVGVQAQARGVLARKRHATRAKEIDGQKRAFVRLQAQCRGWLARREDKQTHKALAAPVVVQSITAVQAVLRGRLARQVVAKERHSVQALAPTVTKLQGHIRSALVRRQHKAREQTMDDATSYIVAIQTQARGILARRRKQMFTKSVVTLTSSVSSFQALARGRLAKKTHDNMQKALAKVEVAGSVGGLQAFLRTRLAKRQTVEQKKKLEFVQPDVIGFQAVARGYLARQEYREWRDYLVDPHTQGALVFLQSLSRGFIVRRKFWMRWCYLHHNVDKIVKVQSMWRGRKQRQMYERLITGVGVDVPTVQNYMHLLDDTETDFRDQLCIDTLRKEVVELLRTNQTLETEVKELDTKIALILKNKMSFEDLVRAKRRHGAPTGDEAFHPPGGGDPFTSVHLDRASQRKLELFEHLFFTLQTEPKYLSRLLHKLAADPEADRDRLLVEAVTLILFGFGHDKREEYLFHKLLQISVHEQVLRSRSLKELRDSRFAIISVVTQYVKPHLTPYIQHVLAPQIQCILSDDLLDLATDPVEIYHRIINAEESLTGVKSDLPRDLDADQVLQTHTESRTTYIHNLQKLHNLTAPLATSLMESTAHLPYTVRLIAREALLALRVRYQGVEDRALWPVIAKAILLPFITPAIIAPETYGLADNVNPIQRRNLAAIANVLGHVAAQDNSPTDSDRLIRVPLNAYISAEGKRMGDWVLDVAEVDFQVQEMLESTSEATPIAISRSDIYGLLSVVIQNIPALTAGKTGDPIESVLNELEGPPVEYDKSKNTVRVRLTNRLAQLQPSDPFQAQVRELEVQAKRHVIAVLRIQTGKDLYEVLLRHPSEEDEEKWIAEVHRDIALEQARKERHDLPPTPVEAEYQMESIRSLPFHEVKSRAIEFCMLLVECGRLSRDDKFEGLLVSIASDIKEKHRLRQKRKVDLQSMAEAHAHLSEKRTNFEEQIQSYHDYIDSAMAALQQKKKAPFMSKQYWHQKGTKSKFGSYKYTAEDLNKKGVLLSVNQLSPRQFGSVHIIISSDKVGVFKLEMTNLSGGNGGGHEELHMEDLLQAQFDNNVRLDLFDSQAAFNLNMLIHQINKKFYAS